MTEQIQAESNASDEIDLRELLRSVLATRVPVVISLLVVSIVFWVAQIALNFVNPEVYRYDSRIDFIFDGVQEGQYPNGSPFALPDLLAPVVLNAVYDANDVADYSSRNEFLNSFVVEPYTPERGFILARYQALLANKKLTPAETQELQDQLEVELKQAALGSATLAFIKTGRNDTPVEVIQKVLREVPQEWSRHMINDKGVERHDVIFYSGSVVNEGLVNSLDYLIGFEVVLDRLKLLEQNIETLKSLPNGLVIVDEVTGLKVTDLERGLLDIRRYAITPLINPIRTLGIAKDVENVKLYFANELRDLSRATNVLKLKQENVKTAYADYAEFNVMSPGKPNPATSSSIIPQFGSEFLDRILDLSNMGADISYRQGLNKELLDISNRLADSEGERQRIQDLIDSLNAGSVSDISATVRERYEAQIVESLPMVLKQIQDYFSIANRVYQVVSAEQLSSSKALFRPSDGGINASVTNRILNFSHVRLYLIVCFLVAVIAVPTVMIRNAMK